MSTWDPLVFRSNQQASVYATECVSSQFNVKIMTFDAGVPGRLSDCHLPVWVGATARSWHCALPGPRRTIEGSMFG